MKNENYITIQGWMVNDLELSGNELMLYALIYGFCQDDESKFTGSLKYICNWLSCSRPTAMKALKNLVKKGYISKEEIDISGVRFNHYKTLPVVKKLYQGGKETLPGGGKETLPGGGKETLPYNTINNSTIIDIDNNIPAKRKNKSFKEFSEDEFYEDIAKYSEKFNKKMMREFFDWWREKSPSGKMKFQLQKTWETNLRLQTWERRSVGYSGNIRQGTTKSILPHQNSFIEVPKQNEINYDDLTL